jgi:RNase P subunit RPR2
MQGDMHVKMASTNIAATINYLTDSAHRLYASAPETSAHLIRERRELLVQQNIPIPEVHWQHFCGACGYILIPGEDDSSLRLDARKPVAKGKTRAQKAHSVMTRGPVKNITCGHCHITTRMTLPAPAPAARHKARKPKSKAYVSGSTSGVTSETPKASANASSKKRAKTRKAGLQSLLSGHQKQQSRPLSLSDFMKK